MQELETVGAVYTGYIIKNIKSPQLSHIDYIKYFKINKERSRMVI